MARPSAKNDRVYRPTIAQGQVFRAIGWALGLSFLVVGRELHAVEVTWPGHVAGLAAMTSCLLIWIVSQGVPRWAALSLWFLVDTLALTVLVGATGFHDSPLFIWLLAPAVAAVLEGVIWLMWATAALGLASYLGMEAWAQFNGLIQVPWAEVIWRGINLFAVGAVGLDLASGWLRSLATKRQQRDQERYQALLEGVSDGYYECDLKGRFTFCNISFANIFGFEEPRQIIGKDGRGFMSPPMWNEVFKVFNKIYKSGEGAEQKAFEVHRPDGSQRFIEVSITPVLDQRNAVTGFRGTARDVTSRIETDEALAASEAKHRTMFELSSEGLVLLDDTGRALDCNRRMAEILGVERADIIGRMEWAFAPPEQENGRSSQEYADELIRKSLAGEELFFEWLYLHKDLSTIHCEVALKAIELEENRKVIFASVRDISVRRAIVAELARSREMFRSLYESASHDEQVLRGLLSSTGDPVVIYDSEGCCLFINRAFTKTFGWTSEELLGRPIDYIPDDELDRPDRINQGPEADRQVVDLATQRLTKDGRRVHVSLTRSVIKDEKDATAETLVILRDITAQLENERTMRRLYETQKELARRDPLTGLYNHRQMQKALDDELELATKSAQPVALVMMDLDGFKKLNDTHGHLAGDDALKLVARVLQRNCRARDHVARWGGDEFMLILPGSDAAAAQAVCRRVIKDLSSRRVELEGGGGIQVSASLGLAMFPLDSAVKERLLSRVDSAMYLAKARPGSYVLKMAPNSSLVSRRERGFDVLLELNALVNEHQGNRHDDAKWAAHWAETLGRLSNLDEQSIEELGKAAMIRDVGKVCLPAAWLRADADLDPNQERILRRHPIYGLTLLRQLSDLGPLAQEAVLNHHESYIGDGYPNGLAGGDIPLEGRILAVCEAYTDLWLYQGFDEDQAAAKLRGQAGKRLDPDLTVSMLDSCFEQPRPGLEAGTH